MTHPLFCDSHGFIISFLYNRLNALGYADLNPKSQGGIRGAGFDGTL